MNRTKTELDRIPLSEEQKRAIALMGKEPGQKVVAPEKTVTGTGETRKITYAGSFGSELDLSAPEQRAIRQVLGQASEPMHITDIAQKSGISIYNPHKQSAVSRFIADYLVTTREVERVEELNARNRAVFKGYALTEHGRSLQQKGLA